MLKKINIGCGNDVRAGYENIDARVIPGVRQHDLLEGLPYEDGQVSEVLAQDVLEHFPREVLISKILPEIYRVLSDDGELVLQCPDMHEMVRLWQSGQCDDDTMSMRIHGRQDYPGNTHYSSYTQDSMSRLLRAAGFKGVTRVATRNWNMVLKAVKKESAAAPPLKEGSGWQAYWEERAQKHGRRAITPVHWDDKRQAKETNAAWEAIREFLPFAEGARVLDFGCGVGRWSKLLVQEGLNVTGIDMSARMVELAQAEGVDAFQVSETEELPFPEGSFDGLFVFTVLQHIPDSHISGAVERINRVLVPGAPIVLVENTSTQFGRTSKSGHVVFRKPEEYSRFFPGLKEHGKIIIENELHHWMIRK